MEYKILAVIPARGGSKGIPRKNIKSLFGRPLLQYTVEPALESKLISRVVVSSDDDEILDLSHSLGSDTLKRPSNLATDSASSIDVVIHATFEMEKKYNENYDIVVMLQPTTPFRAVRDIDTALSKLIADDLADSVISVVKSPGINPEWMKYIIDGRLVDFDSDKKENGSRQETDIYIRNGAIYATRREILINSKSFKGLNCLPYIMPSDLWVNIDNFRDWQMAELILKNMDNKNNSYKKGSVTEFDDSWKSNNNESSQNYFIKGQPINQIMMSFKNQWEVYKSFIGEIKTGMKSLEPGSGRGSISCYFANDGFDAYLLDTSAEILEFAKDIYKVNGLEAKFVCADALNMPFSDDFFDVIVHCGLLEHFEDYQKALDEQYRVIKPGGLIICNIVPGKWSVQKAFGFINYFLKKSYSLLVKFNFIVGVNKKNKPELYRSDHGSQVYVDYLKKLGADIEYQGGIFPVPSISYSPEFPFTLMPPRVELLLVKMWRLVLNFRKIIWPKRHPWMCSEKWGQHVLVVARKPISK